jgi:hypothetical protein
MFIALNNNKEARVILDNLISSSSELKYIAMEYLGYIEMNEANISKAKIIFENIAKDAATTENMKNRSREVLSILP